jgi:hypothetical protein
MMLRQLADKGPETVGIFRRGPNVRAMRDIRDKLDEGGTVHWDQISVFVTAALLKVRRHLPSRVTIREVLHFMYLIERVLRVAELLFVPFIRFRVFCEIVNK